MTPLSRITNLCRQMARLTQPKPATRRCRRAAGPISHVEVLETRQLLSVDSFVKLANGMNGAPEAREANLFGRAAAGIGDLDGDGVNDLVVASLNAMGDVGFGAVDILFMSSDGTVRSTSSIASGVNGGPNLDDGETFGWSVVSLGDLDGDGVTDLAVGGNQDNADGDGRGSVFILHLNSDGTVKSSTKIGNGLNGGPTLANFSDFGFAVAAIGDIDNDSIPDLAASAPGESNSSGAIYILRLNADGSVKSSTRVADGVNGGPTTADGDEFGDSLASVGDLNLDGVNDLAVGSPLNSTGGPARGAVHILFMNADGTVDSSTLIASGTNGGPTLADVVLFGSSVAFLGDVDGDGRPELAVGSEADDTGAVTAGAVYLLNLNTNGTVQSSQKIASGLNGGPPISTPDSFGSAVTNIGDLDGDGITDLAVGAEADSTVESFQGAVYVLFLNGVPSTAPPVVAINGGAITYHKRDPATAVAPNLTLTDADTDPEKQVPGGKIVISIEVVTNKKRTKVFDKLELNSLSTVGTVGATQVVNGRANTTIQLSASATLAQIVDALRAITFSTEKKGLKTPTRTVQIRAFDKSDTASNLAKQTINVSKKKVKV